MNNIKKFFIGAGATAILLGSVLPALAVGLNGSFETGTDPVSFTTVLAGQTNVDNWAVDSGSIDYIGSYWQASDGTRSIDLNGNEMGSISQSLTTVTGATYKVSFDLSGNPDGSPSVKTLNVSATGTAPAAFNFDTTVGNTHENMMWTPKEYSFIATGTSTTLTFASTTEGAYGPAVDHVVIQEEVPVTPTPTDTPTPTPNPYAVPAECVVEGVVYGAPIVGTNGSNIINGTAGNDLIFALGGSDVVNGKGGNDCIVGGDGSDVIHGDNGNDVILGGQGSDAIQGDAGNDWIYGQDGSDSLKGGANNDHLFGGNGSDSLKGDGGTDNADGGNNSDACNAETETTCEA